MKERDQIEIYAHLVEDDHQETADKVGTHDNSSSRGLSPTQGMTVR
jgi:hypothetical protein